jgi:ABC-type polar amino acid transport system ATPase subunit
MLGINRIDYRCYLKTYSASALVAALVPVVRNLITSTGSASMIEDLLANLKEQCTLIVVTHYLYQVSRIADKALKLEACGFRQV